MTGGRVLLALLVVTSGCTSATSAASATVTSAHTTATASATTAPASAVTTSAVTTIATTTIATTSTTATATTTTAPSAAASTTVASTTVAPTAAASTTVAPTTAAPTTSAPGGVSLPTPDGPDAVGVADVPALPNTVVYYPAVAGTGSGPRSYVDADLALADQLPVDALVALRTSASVGATPAPASAPRPVVIITPGWRSLVALSTTLAEELASHGDIVLATQTDVVTEASHPKLTPDDRTTRWALLERQLDLVTSPGFAAFVGPVDASRIAVGGHSYAGTVAFTISLRDRRIAAVFDLDGGVSFAAATTPTTVPTLMIIADGGSGTDHVLAALYRRSHHTVAVGLVGALHLDLTDAATLAPLIGGTPVAELLGAIGPVATTDTSTIVQRFLAAALGPDRRLATADELVADLPATSTTPFLPGT